MTTESINIGDLVPMSRVCTASDGYNPTLALTATDGCRVAQGVLCHHAIVERRLRL